MNRINWNVVEINPRFFEVDSYGIVNNVFHLSWCELGRFAIAKEIGFHSEQNDNINSSSIQFLVSESHIKYKMPAYFEDTIRIETAVLGNYASKITFLHRIKRKKTNKILSTAKVSVVYLENNQLQLKFAPWMEQMIYNYINYKQGEINEKKYF